MTVVWRVIIIIIPPYYRSTGSPSAVDYKSVYVSYLNCILNPESHTTGLHHALTTVRPYILCGHPVSMAASSV